MTFHPVIEIFTSIYVFLPDDRMFGVGKRIFTYGAEHLLREELRTSSGNGQEQTTLAVVFVDTYMRES